MVSVDFSACFAAALMLLILPLNWISAAFFAALIHELFHAASVCLCGGRVLGVRIGAGGAVMETSQLDTKREILCTLAGPVGSLSLTLLSASCPRLAICGFIQGIFNLIPIYPLDGGRVVFCLLSALCPKWCHRIAFVLEILSITGLFAAAIWAGILLHMGDLPVFAALALILKCLRRKIPCKQARIGVQ